MDTNRRRTSHEQALPHVNAEECAGCGTCAKLCFRRAISFTENEKAVIFPKRCIGMESCGRCVHACSRSAIKITPLKVRHNRVKMYQ